MPSKREITVTMPEGADRPFDLASSTHLKKVFGTSEAALMSRKLAEITNLLWMPEGIGIEEAKIQALRAVEFYESLEPGDGAEGMLAAQMVGTHFAALECLRRAALPNQTFKGRDMALKHAQKLMTLYTQQLAALNKHRGKGQQKVTVEHVHVEAGGQAIVGNVETGRATSAPPAAIEERNELPINAPPVNAPPVTKPKSRRKP